MAGVVNIVSLQLFLITNSSKKEIQPKHVQHKTCDTSMHSSLSGLQPTFFTLRLQMQCSSAKKVAKTINKSGGISSVLYFN